VNYRMVMLPLLALGVLALVSAPLSLITSAPALAVSCEDCGGGGAGGGGGTSGGGGASGGSGNLFEWNTVLGSGQWSLTDVTGATGFATSKSIRAVPFLDPNGNLDVFAANPSGQLLLFSRPLGGGFYQVQNLSAAVGGMTIVSEPSPIHYGNGVQVFALGGDGNEQAWVQSQPGAAWQVFPVSNSQPLAGNPQAITDGTNVHVYAYRSDNHHLMELFKPQTTGWQLFDLSATVSGVDGVNPTPYLYGGNSVQTLAINDATHHLWAYVELFAGPSQGVSSFDLTALAGAPAPIDNPKPALFPEGGTTVEVFGPGHNSGDQFDKNLVNYQKIPTSNWQYFDTSNNSIPQSGIINQGIPAPIVDGNDIHVFGHAHFDLGCQGFNCTNVFDTVVDWFKTPSVANWQAIDIGQAVGRHFASLSDPGSMFVDSTSTIEVFATGS